MRRSSLPILGHFCSFAPFLVKKSKFSKNEKKRLEILSFYILLGVLLNVGVKKHLRQISNWDQNKFNKKGVKINVGVRIFQWNIKHSFIISDVTATLDIYIYKKSFQNHTCYENVT